MRILARMFGCLGLVLSTVSAQAMDAENIATHAGGGASWSAYIGGIALNRSKPQGVDGFDFGWQTGLELDVRRDIFPGYQVQFRYLGLDKWSESAQTLQYGMTEGSANLHSLEVNLFRQQSERVTILGGFRSMTTREAVEDSQSDTARMRNRMYGAQLGAEFLAWDDGGPLTITTGLKAGLFHNRARRDASFGPTPLSRRSTTAVAAEWDVVARFEVSDQMRIRAGYQFLWLNRVASFDAPQIQAINAGDRVDTKAKRLHHGASVGVEWTF